MTTTTLENRIENYKKEQAEKLAVFVKEETLRDELSQALDLSPEKAFIHVGKLYGVHGSVHFREKMSFTEAVETIAKLERLMTPVDMLEARDACLSHPTRAYFEQLPDDKAMKYKTTAILPVRVELSRFGDSLKYWGMMLSDYRVIEIKISLDAMGARPFHWVDCVWNKTPGKSKIIETYCRSMDSAFTIHDNDGQSLGEKIISRMYDSEGPSQNYLIHWRNNNEDAKDFSIKHLLNWSRNWNEERANA